MLQRTHSFGLALALALILTAVLGGCASAPTAAPAPTATAPQAAEAAPTQPPTPTAEPPTPTATVERTATTAPTATVEPTATALPEPGTVEGWCLPENTSISYTAEPLNPPAFAKIGAAGPNGLVVPNLPGSACVFTYDLGAPASGPLTLQVSELRPGGGASAPWLTADLKPVEGSPNKVAAVLNHSYIVAFPYWEVTYQFALVDASGKELRADMVNLRRWTPEPCWNGRLPNPLTLRCPLQQDLHPWDAGYGTPMPTPDRSGED